MNKFNCQVCEKKIKGTGKTNMCRNCAVAKYYKNPKNHPNYIDNRTNIQHYCIDCNKEITCQAIRCRSCSQKEVTKKLERIEKFPKKGKLHPSYIDGRTNKKYYCPDCGKILSNYKAKRCQSCAMKKRWNGKKYRENHTNKNHYRYKDGLGRLPYTTQFTQKLKDQIKERDNYTCQHCGMTQEEHYKKYNRDIEIHHIDYNKYNCKENNLITTCHKCNVLASNDRDYYYAYFIYIIKEIK